MLVVSQQLFGEEHSPQKTSKVIYRLEMLKLLHQQLEEKIASNRTHLTGGLPLLLDHGKVI
jgi:hypothetical protein